jgi:hypothetical protein
VKEATTMMKNKNLSRIALMLGTFALALGFYATGTVAAGPGNVTVTVTAVGKKDSTPPAITKDDVQVYLNKERTQVANWKRGEKLYLAVVIDDSLDSGVASQWSDLKAFFAAQPDTTYISVGYARNGAVTLAQDFTNDHELAAKALRIPMGGGAFSSPYLSILDLMKRWPASGDRRSILLISSGIDYFRGGGFGPKSPDLDPAIERAQKQNINVWSIYAPGSGHTSRGFFRSSTAQSNLGELADETGAESYSLGSGLAVTFKPWLDEIGVHLNNQYLLTFNGSGGKKGRFERLRVHTELPNTEFMAPAQVFLPPATPVQ